MKIKLDLSQFKLKNKTDKHATLVHPDGHEFKVAVSALHPENRKNFDSLKMADGGEVSENDIIEAKKQTDEYNKTHEDSPSEYPKEVESYLKAHEPKKMADGGEVAANSDGQTNQEKAMEAIRKAFGGKKSQPKPSMYYGGGEVDPNTAEGQSRSSIADAFNKKAPAKPSKPSYPMYADGGDVEASSAPALGDLDPQALQQMGITPEMMAPQSMQAPGSSPNLPQSAPNQPESMQAPGAQVAAPQGPQSGAAQQATSSPAQQSAPAGGDVPGPDFAEGYKNQAAGIINDTKAQQQIAHDTENVLKGKAQGLMDIQQQYQKHVSELDDERKSLQQDIMDGHIDPTRYLGSMDTASRIQTGIALALGGLGGALHGGNQALEFINKQIDRDIEAQKADLGKKENLLSANMRQYGNLAQATDVTRAMMLDTASTGVQQAMAKSGSQAALARGQQLLGQLQQQAAGPAQQAAIRGMLYASNQQSAQGQGKSSGLIKEDPARFVSALVPQGEQPAVLKEIERAQNTKRMSAPILKAYDDAAESLSGLGRAEALIKNPRELDALQGLLNTTVTDLTGTARQAEFDSVREHMTPNKYDTANDKAIKRRELVQYLQAKASAPAAKSYGIDLEKFNSTALLPESNLTGPQKVALEWARQNPNHPAAQKVFKKLNVNE